MIGLDILWTDTCTITRQVKQKNEETALTESVDEVIAENQPCRISFRSSSIANAVPAAKAPQETKLFLTNEITVPAGCKVVVSRNNKQGVFAYSSEAAVYSTHQEITLEKVERWA